MVLVSLTNYKSALLGVCPIPGIAPRDCGTPAMLDTLIPGLHSRRYSARLLTHAVVSAPPKGRRRLGMCTPNTS
jgi:hypothetical protein